MIQKLLTLRSKLMSKVEKLDSLALLVLRVSVGIVFVVTGWGKLHNLEQITEFFRSLGIPAPELQAPFVAALEFCGGLALILGLGARLFALPLMGTMVVAILTAKKDRIDDWTDLFDFIEWHYLVSFLVVAILGPGKLSLDFFIAKALNKTAPVTPAAQAPSGAQLPPAA